MLKNKIHHLDTLNFLKSFNDNFFDLIIIDPPYNIGKDFGNNSDSKKMQEYIDWSLSYLKECFRVVKKSSLIYLYGFPEIISHLAVHFPIENQRWLTWHYTNKTVPSSKFWQRSFETILCLWKGKKPILKVDEIREDYTKNFLKNSAGKIRKSKDCRYSKGNSTTIYKANEKGALPRDVLKIPSLAGGSGYSERVLYCKDCRKIVFGKEKENHNECEIIKHPTQKPFQLTEKLIKSCSPKNLLIPFAGSGSECIVAQNLGINFYATEINKNYVFLANQWLKESSKFFKNKNKEKINAENNERETAEVQQLLC